MTPATAAAAAEYKSNLGPDFQMLDALDPDYLDTEEVEDVDLMSVGKRQALNARMADWFGG